MRVSYFIGKIFALFLLHTFTYARVSQSPLAEESGGQVQGFFGGLQSGCETPPGAHQSAIDSRDCQRTLSDIAQELGVTETGLVDLKDVPFTTTPFGITLQIYGYGDLSLTSNETSKTCAAGFQTPGWPRLFLKLGPDQGQLTVWNGSVADLQGQYSAGILNADTLLSQKGRLSVFFSTGSGNDSAIKALYVTSNQSALWNYQSFQFQGNAQWFK